MKVWENVKKICKKINDKANKLEEIIDEKSNKIFDAMENLEKEKLYLACQLESEKKNFEGYRLADLCLRDSYFT